MEIIPLPSAPQNWVVQIIITKFRARTPDFAIIVLRIFWKYIRLNVARII
jgi:hypothetical protein